GDGFHLGECGGGRVHRNTRSVQRFAVETRSERRRSDQKIDKRLTLKSRAALWPSVRREIVTRRVRGYSKFAELAANQAGIGRACDSHGDIGLAASDIERTEPDQQVHL